MYRKGHFEMSCLCSSGYAGKLSHMTTSFNTQGVVPSWELQDRIARARRHAHLEQGELGELAGVSRKSISRYETGQSTPRRAALIAIAFATGVDLNWLENGETPAGNHPGGGRKWAIRDSNPEPADLVHLRPPAA